MVAIKIAPFNRYQTLDVVRAVAEAGRDDVALYTGNDDNIVARPADAVPVPELRRRRSSGGSSAGCWASGPSGRAGRSSCCDECHAPGPTRRATSRPSCSACNVELTDANAAIFDAANGFAGCIAGIHEVLRRQGLLEGIWCLDPNETLGPGQAEEIDRRLPGLPAPDRRRLRPRKPGPLADRLNARP